MSHAFFLMLAHILNILIGTKQQNISQQGSMVNIGRAQDKITS
jgi:hypothetical protein